MAEKVRLVTENDFLRERFLAETEAHLTELSGTSGKIQDVLRIVSRLKDNRRPFSSWARVGREKNWWPAPSTSADRSRKCPLLPSIAAR